MPWPACRHEYRTTRIWSKPLANIEERSVRTRVGLTSAAGVRSALLLRWFVFHRVAIELGIRQLRCCCFVDDVCCSLYLPSAIFDFDVRPTTSGPERADRGSCAVSCRNDKPAVGLNVPWR